jgi:hypothetical protein
MRFKKRSVGDSQQCIILKIRKSQIISELNRYNCGSLIKPVPVVPYTKPRPPSVVGPYTKPRPPSVVGPYTKPRHPSVVVPYTKPRTPSVKRKRKRRRSKSPKMWIRIIREKTVEKKRKK